MWQLLHVQIAGELSVLSVRGRKSMQSYAPISLVAHTAHKLQPINYGGQLPP
jgi:hypothetical protein